MTRDYDEMEDDNPIEEDGGQSEFDFCGFCGKVIPTFDDFCSDQCELEYKEKYIDND